MPSRDPREQRMRQHRPIDHDRHTRIMPLARNDASPAVTHQLVSEQTHDRVRLMQFPRVALLTSSGPSDLMASDAWSPHAVVPPPWSRRRG
jgi:hypothetical protein